MARRDQDPPSTLGVGGGTLNADKSISARLCEVAQEKITTWQQNSNSPFAMWLSFLGPHEFYQAPKDVYDSIDPDSLALPEIGIQILRTELSTYAVYAVVLPGRTCAGGHNHEADSSVPRHV